MTVYADCPECGGDAAHVDESHALKAIYGHRDDYAQCGECGHIFAYRGVADDPREGFSFYDIEAGTGTERPKCPKHEIAMTATKVWPSDGRVQFKCDEPDEDLGEPCQRVRYADLE